MKLEDVPNISDGGYWYVFEAIQDPELGNNTPGDLPGVGWCAWYANINSVLYVVVRTPEPISGVETTNEVTVSEILDASSTSGKPRGRVGGK